MGRGLLITSIVFGFVALLCGIVALGTPNWIKACLPFTDILKGAQSLSGNIPGSSQASLDQLNQQSYMFEGKDVCYNSGLFALSAEFMGFHFSLPLSHSVPAIKAATGLLIAGLLVVAIAVIILTWTSCSRSRNAQKQVQVKAYCRIAVAVMVVGSLLYGAGLATYTVEQTTNVLHNPHGYLTQMGSGMQSSFQDIMGGGGHSSMGGLSGYSTGGAGKRKRRQAMLDEGFDAPHNEESVDPADLQKKALAMFKNMDPVFGYSYYIAWLGFVFAILSIVFSVLSVVQKQLLYADDVDPLPVF